MFRHASKDPQCNNGSSADNALEGEGDMDKFNAGYVAWIPIGSTTPVRTACKATAMARLPFRRQGVECH